MRPDRSRVETESHLSRPRRADVAWRGLLIACLAASVFGGGCSGAADEGSHSKGTHASGGDNAGGNGLAKAEAAELIGRHHELVASGRQPTDKQRKQFAQAYYRAGRALAKRGRYAEAERYYIQALRLEPKHARAAMRLGDIYAVQRKFKAASDAYKAARQYDSSLSGAVKKRRWWLCNYVLAIADQRLEDSWIAGTKEVLDFVQANLNDIGGEEARRRLAKITPLLEAEAALNAARQDLEQYRKEAGYAKLRQVAAKYPRTHFGQEANRLLESNGQKIVLAETATGYKLPLHWRRTSTEHFIVYYEKRSGLQGTMRYAEEHYERIVSDFKMADAGWKTRVTLYLFSDDESWHDFLAMNRDRTMEWAGGFALPWASEIYLYVTDKKSYLYKGVLPHELTHVLHHRYVGGIYQPIWLTEGLAVSQEKGGVKESRRAVDDFVDDNEAFPLERLFGLTEYPRRSINLFYAQSATVVGFMIDEWGIAKLKQFMFTFAGTYDTEQAIRSVYGLSLDAFEKKWEKYVR